MSKNYIMVIVSYETGGGHGEHDAIEEGLRGRIEGSLNELIGIEMEVHPPFKVELLEGTNQTVLEELEEERDYIETLEKYGDETHRC